MVQTTDRLVDQLIGGVHRMGVGREGAQLRCGVMRTPADYVEEGFVTPQYALVYLPRAYGWYTDSRGRAHRLEPGCLFQRFPSQPHSARIETPGLRYFLGVPCQVFELFALTGLANPQRPVLPVGTDRSLTEEFVRIREALRGQPDHELASVLLRMQNFIADLLRRGRERAADAETFEPIARAMQLLNENLSQRLHLPDIARQVDMSYSLFRKRFLDQVGTSPGDYRIRRRIERSMALLTRGSLLIKEIAAQLGYPDEYAFSAQFKRVAGVSPSAFRKRHG